MQNFIAQSMRRMGLAPENKSATAQSTPSRIGHNSTAPLAHMEVGSKWSYSTLEYPMDIQSRTDLGHYMMFYINVPNNTTYGRSGGVASSKGSLKGADKGKSQQLSLQQQQIIGEQEISKESKDGSIDVTGKSWKPGTPEKVIDRKSHQGTAAGVMGMQRTKRTTDSIVLYMPAQLTTNYAAGYKSTELGGELGELGGRITAAMKSNAEGLSMTDAAKEAFPGFAGQGKRLIERAAAKLTSQIIGGDALGAYDKISNRAMNNFLETTFTGVDFRKFSYSWKFAPKNVEEVFMAEKIIRLFKFHMLPELPNDDQYGRYYVVPSEFDIFYMFRGDENTWMNKIQTSVLVNMEVNYSPNQYNTFRPVQGRSGAPPTEIDMKLDFMETKIITKADVSKGF